MDINLCIEKLGLSGNSYRLSQSVPPYQIIEWLGPDPQPSDFELEAVWKSVEYGLKATAIREERNKLLTATDWRALADQTLSDEWRDYRQALRDISSQETFPDEVVWPTEPQ